MTSKDYIRWIRSKVGHEKIILTFAGGCIFNDQDETLELKYFSKEEKPQLFTGSHEELWNDIFNRS